MPRSRKQIQERGGEVPEQKGTPTNMSLEDFEEHQQRFTSALQPASHRRGNISKSELYAQESRLIEEMILRGFPAMVWEQIQIATGQKTEAVVNHATGAVEYVPVSPKTQVQAFKELRDTVFGKPETTRHEKVEVEEFQRLEILIGPASAEHWESQVIEVVDPGKPLVLPPPPVEELALMSPAHEKREIRKLVLDRHLQGDSDAEIRRAVHEEFGGRPQRRARRKAVRGGEDVLPGS